MANDYHYKLGLIARYVSSSNKNEEEEAKGVRGGSQRDGERQEIC